MVAVVVERGSSGGSSSSMASSEPESGSDLSEGSATAFARIRDVARCWCGCVGRLGGLRLGRCWCLLPPPLRFLPVRFPVFVFLGIVVGTVLRANFLYVRIQHTARGFIGVSRLGSGSDDGIVPLLWCSVSVSITTTATG